jgi:glycosyltransferase involved in cell wall biosynthesis
LPSEGWREYRSYMIAKALSLIGHQVVWWISDFEHRSKRYRDPPVDNKLIIENNVTVNFVHCPSYHSNISFARIKYERFFGKSFYLHAQNESAPDLIVLAEPSIFYSSYVKKYVQEKRCLLVVDVLDLWPELFYVIFPIKIRWLANFFLFPMCMMRSALINSADAVIGVTSDYVKAVLSSDTLFKPNFACYLGLDLKKYNINLSSFDNKIVKEFVRDSNLVVLYSGSFGNAYDLDTVISSIKELVNLNKGIKFIFVGDGPKKENIQELASLCSREVLFLGLLPSNMLPSVYKYCDIGLCSYAYGSTVSMPVKVYDYFAAGLAIISSLEREISKILEYNQAGLSYISGSKSSLLNCILLLLNNKKYLEIMKKNSKQLALKFDSVDQHNELAKFLTSIQITNKN